MKYVLDLKFLVEPEEDESETRLLTSQNSDVRNLNLIAANLNHLIGNSRLLDCRQIGSDEGQRRLVVFTVENESLIGDMVT
jgi:hypothetical protein